MNAPRHVFGPDAIAAARTLRAMRIAPGDDVIDALAEINRRHPSLSFRDFWGAAVLAQALAIKPRGNA